MATEKIGVEAVFDITQFKSGVTAYNTALGNVGDKTKAAVTAMKGVGLGASNAGLAAKGSGLHWTELASKLSVVNQVVGYAKQGYDALITSTLAAGRAVMDLSRVTGMSAENSSLLIEAADDVKLSVESMGVALKFFIKNGGDPTTETLAKMADEFLKIQPGAERSRFLLETFGKAGLEMGKLLETGSVGIQNMAKDAHRLGLVLSEEDVKATRDLEIAQDDLDDTMKGVALSMGKKLVPAAIQAAEKFKEFINTLNTGFDVFQQLINWNSNLIPVLQQHRTDVLALTTDYGAYATEMDRAAFAAGFLVSETGQLVQAGGLGADTVVMNNYRMSQSTWDMVRTDEYAIEVMRNLNATAAAGVPPVVLVADASQYDEAKRSVDDVVTSLQNLTVASIGAQVIGTLGQLMKDHKITSEQYSEAMMNVGTQMLGMSPAMIIMNTDLASIDTRVKDGSLSFDYYLGRIGAIGGQVSVIQTAAEKQDLLQKAEDANWRTRKDLLAQADTLLPQEFNLTTEVGNQFTEFENLHGSVGTTTTKMALLGGSVKLVTEQQFIPARDVISDLKKKLEDLPRRIQIKLHVTIEGDGKGLIEPPTPRTPPPRGNRAAGGPVYPGQTYVVGEQRPEVLVMGRGGGFVYPSISNFNSQAVSNNTNTKNVSINVKSSQPVLRSAINALDVLRVLA